MTRRYSHLGPVLHPRGRPVSKDTIAMLWQANKMLGWGTIAKHIGVGRSTLYRVVEGGNAHEGTAQAIETFATTWSTADDTVRASMMRRWGEKEYAARAAYIERSRRAA